MFSLNSSWEENAVKVTEHEVLKRHLVAGAIWFNSYFPVQNTSPSYSHERIKKNNYLHQLLWIQGPHGPLMKGCCEVHWGTPQGHRAEKSVFC